MDKEFDETWELALRNWDINLCKTPCRCNESNLVTPLEQFWQMCHGCRQEKYEEWFRIMKNMELTDGMARDIG